MLIRKLAGWPTTLSKSTFALSVWATRLTVKSDDIRSCTENSRISNASPDATLTLRLPFDGPMLVILGPSLSGENQAKGGAGEPRAALSHVEKAYLIRPGAPAEEGDSTPFSRATEACEGLPRE